MKPKILIIDDNSSMRHALRVILRESGYDVLEANDGPGALALLDGRPIDLIISDLNMPHMDGITLATEVKKQPDYTTTQFIMLSSEVSPEKRAAGKAAGITGWMAKPFHAGTLVMLLQKLFPQAGSA